MKLGVLYGIGIGPGDPDLITLKGARLLGNAQHVFVPKARTAADSLALTIAKKHISAEATIHEIVFPMTTDTAELACRWQSSAQEVAAVLRAGTDACFITLGDAYLYSTYIYLVRALREILPKVKIETVPGVTAFSAAAALANFPIGEAKEPVTIVPVADDLTAVRTALNTGGTAVLMKIGKHAREILGLLAETGHIDNAVLVSHVGLPEQRIETDLRKLRAEKLETEYLAVILVHARKGYANG